eukprot:m51a1_g14615 hypothetical protein (79) ;mRNA; f:1214138-1214560
MAPIRGSRVITDEQGLAAAVGACAGQGVWGSVVEAAAGPVARWALAAMPWGLVPGGWAKVLAAAALGGPPCAAGRSAL